MRAIAFLLGLLVLAACGRDQGGADQDAGTDREAAREITYSGPGRNQLCWRGNRVGFIAYASSGDTNCSVRGLVQRQGSALVIQPDGDSDCRIEAREDGNSLVFGPVTPACRYYCGPNASYAGAVFDMVPASRPVTDFAGDPLC